MKRFFKLFAIVAILAFTSINANAQLITKGTLTHDKEYTILPSQFWLIKDGSEGAYYMASYSSNQYEHSRIYVYLGDTKESAIQSCKDMLNLYETTNKKDAIVVMGRFGKETSLIRGSYLGNKCFWIAQQGVAGQGLIIPVYINKCISKLESEE